MGFFSLDSSHWELSVVCHQIFSISYRFRDKRGQTGQKCDFGGYIKFIFFIQFWWDFFLLDSSQWELSELLKPFFPISYRFWDTRGPKGQKCDFGGHKKFSFFIQFWWDFFHWIPLNESFQNCSADFFYLLPFLRYKGPKKAKTQFSVEC